jgi:hypothetical protein
MGYRLTREKKLLGRYYLWHGALPVIIGDLTLVKRFLITDPATRAAIEDERKAEIAARITDPATRAETRDRVQAETGVYPGSGIPMDDREAMIGFLRKGYVEGTLQPPPSYLPMPPPPSFPMRDSSVDSVSVPISSVAVWSECPACGGKLVIVEGAGDCIGCRRIWCDPDRKPTLDKRGKLVGTKLPTEFDSGEWNRIGVFLRFPPPEGLPLPSD